MAKVYSPDERENALALYVEHGAGETARRLQIPAPTITSWAKRAGVQSNAPESTRAAVEMGRLRNEQRRVELVKKLYDRAERALDRITEPQTDYKGQQAREVLFDEASPEAVERFAKAAASLLEKGELLSGQATSRTESTDKDELGTYLLGLRDAYEHRSSKQATE